MARQVLSFLLSGLIDSSGDPLSGGKVYCYDAGTLNARNVYAAQSGGSPAANPIILGSRGTSQRYGEGNYKFVVVDADDNPIDTFDNIFIGTVAVSGFDGDELEDVGEATEATSAAQYGQLLDGKPHFVTDTTGSTANALLLVPDPAPTALRAGQYWFFIVPATNTGAVTANVGGTGVDDVKKVRGAATIALDPGDLQIGALAMIGYDGTQYILLKSIEFNNRKILYGAGGGTANAHTVSTIPAVSSLTAGDVIQWVALTTNTGALTLAVNGGAALAVNLENGDALPAGTVLAGGTYEARYTGSSYIFNLTAYTRVVDRMSTLTSATNTTSPVTIYTKTIPANALQKGKFLHLRAWGNFVEGNNVNTLFTVTAKLGATSIGAMAAFVQNTGNAWSLNCIILADSLTSQKISTVISRGNTDDGETATTNSCAEDMSASKDLTIVALMGAANAANFVNVFGAVLEYI